MTLKYPLRLVQRSLAFTGSTLALKKLNFLVSDYPFNPVLYMSLSSVHLIFQPSSLSFHSFISSSIFLLLTSHPADLWFLPTSGKDTSSFHIMKGWRECPFGPVPAEHYELITMVTFREILTFHKSLLLSLSFMMFISLSLSHFSKSVLSQHKVICTKSTSCHESPEPWTITSNCSPGWHRKVYFTPLKVKGVISVTQKWPF